MGDALPPVRAALDAVAVAGIVLGGRCAARSAGARQGAQHVRVHEVSAALARKQIAFLDKHLVREHDCVARDAELVGQFAARRQRDLRRQLAVENRGHEHLANLILQARLRSRRPPELLDP